MIPFCTWNITVEHVSLKSCTTALGGAITVVDHQRSTKQREVYKRISVPLAVARQFIKLYNVRRYIKPIEAAIVYYNDQVIALERHPGAEDITWTPNVHQNINNHLIPAVQKGDWCIDGAFAYRVDRTKEETALTADRRFAAVQVDTVKLSDLPIKGGVTQQVRSCLKFSPSVGDPIMSAPIWKNLNRVGVRQLDDDSDDEEHDDRAAASAGVASETDYQFDRIDQYLAVNLSFVLKACRELAEVFGYQVIEPLRLDKLMVQLNTVNLPNLSKDVKQTYDTGLPFTHAIAWLLGLSTKAETLDAHQTIRGLLKHLTTKGVYRKGAFNTESVFVDEETNTESVPLMSREQAREYATEATKGLTFEQFMSRRHLVYGSGSDHERGSAVFEGMYADDG